MKDTSVRLILASQSPQRSELLESHGYDFEVMVPSEAAETGARDGESPRDLVARLGKQKAGDVATRIGEGIVIGCDTVAECEGQTLGKPIDREHAKEMLRLLRGRKHYVHSGLCLWRRPDDKIAAAVDTTTLVMEPIRDRELEDYLDGGGWVGKAGAFGYQDRTGWLKIVDGSESNVVGLPLELFVRLFRNLVP